MMALDIVAYSRRTDPALQLHLRHLLYQLVAAAGRHAQLPLERFHHEDRGDGLLLLAPPDIGVLPLLDPFPRHLRALLRHANKLVSAQARLRLRLAVHDGYLYRDAYGYTSNDLILLFRLLDAPALKTAFTDGDLALIVSQGLYAEIIQHGPGQLDPQTFQRLPVEHKEMHCHAWAQLAGFSASCREPW